MHVNKIIVCTEAILIMLKDSMSHIKLKCTRETTESSNTSAKISSTQVHLTTIIAFRMC